jgi:hypothetical protein
MQLWEHFNGNTTTGVVGTGDERGNGYWKQLCWPGPNPWAVCTAHGTQDTSGVQVGHWDWVTAIRRAASGGKGCVAGVHEGLGWNI